MRSPYSIRKAQPRDLHALAAIELEAAKLLRGHAPESVLDEATDDVTFRTAQAEGRLWVGLAGDVPIGFAHVEILPDGLPHLEEIDVHPAHARRGVGTGLVRAVCEWATEQGHPEITLTTFRALPWNMPFYARMGFEEVPPSAPRPALVAVVREETARGLDPLARLVMRYRCAPGRRAAPPTVGTRQLLLRAPEPTDIDSLFEIQGDAEAMRFTYVAPDRDATAAHVQAHAARFDEDGFAPWTAVLTSERRITGIPGRLTGVPRSLTSSTADTGVADSRRSWCARPSISPSRSSGCRRCSRSRNPATSRRSAC